MIAGAAALLPLARRPGGDPQDYTFPVRAGAVDSFGQRGRRRAFAGATRADAPP